MAPWPRPKPGPHKDRPMPAPIAKALATLLTLATLSACAPLLVGGAGAIVVDEAIKQDQGGDGLF